MKNAKTMAYINMFGVLGTLPKLCELDNTAKEILVGIKPISIGFDVKDGPKATLKFTSSDCTLIDGVENCDIKLPFASCEKFNGLIDGTVTPIPSKGFSKIGFLLKKFVPLTDRLSEVMMPSEEDMQDEHFFELNTKLMFYTIAGSIAQVGNVDDIGMASASYMVDGDILMSIKGGPKATIRVKNNHLTAIKEDCGNARAIMEFGSLKVANDLFNGKVSSFGCIADGVLTIGGMVSMIDNMNRILDRVAIFF